jgi:hypothetical protein
MTTNLDADRLTADHFGMIERLLRQTGLHRHRLADEFRSKAAERFAMAVTGRQKAIAVNPEAYLAVVILRAFSLAKRHYRVTGRHWESLDYQIECGFHPTSREPCPEFTASIREEIDLAKAEAGELEASPSKKRLTPGQRTTLAGIITENPGFNNKQVAEMFLAKEWVSVSGPTIAIYRRRAGVKNPDAGTDWMRRRNWIKEREARRERGGR